MLNRFEVIEQMRYPGDIIKKQRIRLGLSQDELAKKINVGGKSTVSNYENGVSKPDYDILITLSKLFNCTTDYLLGLTAYPNSEVVNLAAHRMEVEVSPEKALEVLTKAINHASKIGRIKGESDNANTPENSRET